MSNAINDVLAERARQRAVEGWTDAHDDAHDDRSLAAAALCYVGQYYGRSWLFRFDGANEYANDPPPEYWPESWSDSWWKPKNPRSDLIRAAAMIIAEVERMDRLAAAQKKEASPGLGDDVPCSKCGKRALDTGLECTECGHDMRPEIYPTPIPAVVPDAVIAPDGCHETAQAYADGWNDCRDRLVAKERADMRDRAVASMIAAQKKEGE